MMEIELGSAQEGGRAERSTRDVEELGEADSRIENKALWALGAQHLSNSWGDRTAEFAFYLYLIQLFKSTLLPASLFGFFTTGVAILLSGTIGRFVDRTPKLYFVRACILLQKIAATCAYGFFLLLFSEHKLLQEANEGKRASPTVWVLFSLITLTGSVLKLATVGISVAVERDWASSIADGNSERLNKINTIIRRIDLSSKLSAPLFVSLLTTAASYPFSVAFLGIFGILAGIFEFWWINIVYRRFPSLSRAPANSEGGRRHTGAIEPTSPHESGIGLIGNKIMKFLRSQKEDWSDFSREPVFMSSVAISALYLTVLSFDGTLISYLKTHAYQDSFIAGMRALCVVAGLVGTIIMPIMEKKIGLVRAGHWSIWAEFISLVPVLLSFYIATPPLGHRAVAWNAALLFGGMAVSRIWLWSFDLCQLKEMQLALSSHPRRNALMGLQFSLQNFADLLKYLLTILLSDPAQFKIAASVSLGAVACGALSYTAYVRRIRGHVFHFHWTKLHSSD